MTSIPPTYWNTREQIVGPALRAEFHSIGQQEARSALEDFVLKRGHDVADAGCNTGVEGVRLFERGFGGTYTGIDSNPRALDLASRNLSQWADRVSLCHADIRQIPLAGGRFDLAFVRDVLEHLPGYEEALREVARLTREHLVASFFQAPHRRRDRIRLTRDGYYLNRYNRAALARFGAGLGFEGPEVIYEQGDQAIFVFRRNHD